MAFVIEGEHLLQSGSHTAFLHHHALVGVMLIVSYVGNDVLRYLGTETYPLTGIYGTFDDA